MLLLISSSVLLALAPTPSLAARARDRENAGLLEQQAAADILEGNPKKALDLYLQVEKIDPSGSPVTKVAQTQIQWLQDRSDGDFQPLTTFLDQKLKLQRGQLTPADLEIFEKAVDGYPPSLVRREARGWIADLWLRRLRDAKRAVDAYQKWLAEPNLEAIPQRIALSGLETAKHRLETATTAPSTKASASSVPAPGPRTKFSTLKKVLLGIAGVVVASITGLLWWRQRPSV